MNEQNEQNVDCDISPPTRADEIVDQLMPDGLEWRRLVCTYPRTSLVISAVGGFVVGKTHGVGLLAGVSGFFFREMTRNVQGIVEDFES